MKFKTATAHLKPVQQALILTTDDVEISSEHYTQDTSNSNKLYNDTSARLPFHKCNMFMPFNWNKPIQCIREK